MNDRQVTELFGLMKAQNAVLATIAECLTTISQGMAPESPNYRRQLVDFPRFDWAGIGAEVTAQDTDGVSIVNWNNQEWKRRSGTGKFGKAIWFSRPVGKDDNGDNLYHRLITFKDHDDAEPLPNGIIPNGAPVGVATGQVPTRPAPQATQPAPVAQPAVPVPQQTGPMPPAQQTHTPPQPTAPVIPAPSDIPQNPAGLLALVQQMVPGKYHAAGDLYQVLGQWPKPNDSEGWQQAYMALVGQDELDIHFPRE